MTRSITRREARKVNACRKCGGEIISLSFLRIGVAFLSKGGCCGECHFKSLATA